MYIIFDRDEKQSAKVSVAAGKKKLRTALSDANCYSMDIIWKESSGKGLDDLIMLEGIGAWNAAAAMAIAKLEKQLNRHWHTFERG